MIADKFSSTDSSKANMTIVDTQRQLGRAVVVAPMFFCIGGDFNRSKTVARVLSTLMPVDIVTSDFNHTLKIRCVDHETKPFEKVVYLWTLPYKSNTSLKRFLSHILFSISVALFLLRNSRRYDVVYTSIPFNLMAWLVVQIAGQRTTIMDVIDIWPDVLPFSQKHKRILRPLMSVWASLFRSAVRQADVLLTVSDSFAAETKRYATHGTPVKRFYIGQRSLACGVEKQPVFTIAYVGNSGRLIDFETLLDVLEDDDCRRLMQLFIVGGGDRKEWLLHQLRVREIRHRYFGIVHEQNQLGQILGSCHVGFNGYVDTNASFSYKANTYLAAGLPIVNSMGGDLRVLVDGYRFGENYGQRNRAQLKSALLSLQRNEPYRFDERSRAFFREFLDIRVIESEMREYLRHNFADFPGKIRTNPALIDYSQGIAQDPGGRFD
jgi:glycosyltransferase involved in cell wall biosynthesis